MAFCSTMQSVHRGVHTGANPEVIFRVTHHNTLQLPVCGRPTTHKKITVPSATERALRHSRTDGAWQGKYENPGPAKGGGIIWISHSHRIWTCEKAPFSYSLYYENRKGIGDLSRQLAESFGENSLSQRVKKKKKELSAKNQQELQALGWELYTLTQGTSWDILSCNSCKNAFDVHIVLLKERELGNRVRKEKPAGIPWKIVIKMCIIIDFFHEAHHSKSNPDRIQDVDACNRFLEDFF